MHILFLINTSVMKRSNLTSRGCFEFLRMSRFQNFPWIWKLILTWKVKFNKIKICNSYENYCTRTRLSSCPFKTSAWLHVTRIRNHARTCALGTVLILITNYQEKAAYYCSDNGLVYDLYRSDQNLWNCDWDFWNYDWSKWLQQHQLRTGPGWCWVS